MTPYFKEMIVWDHKDVADLRDFIAVNAITNGQMSALPSQDIPDDVDTSYPVWAMDKNGDMLVGDSADEIISLEEFRQN